MSPSPRMIPSASPNYEKIPTEDLKFALFPTRSSLATEYSVRASTDITERKQVDEKLRDLSGRFIRAQEDERSRIAREVHDLNQQLALLAIEIEQLKQNPPHPLEAFRSKVDSLGERTEEISDVVYHLSYITPTIERNSTPVLDLNASEQITVRQREVLRLLATGRSMKEVAFILDVTPRTIAFHKYRMMEELNLKSNAELLQFAIRHSIL